MIDFTSSLYLGMRHPHASLPPWNALTTGVPAALEEPRIARRVAAALARLQGCERAILATSTLHLFWDLGGVIDRDADLFVDQRLYAVGRAGVERARSRGATVRTFRHYDPDALAQALKRRSGRRRPIVACDGVCAECGQVAPLAAFVSVVGGDGGWVLVDDTQGLGIVGRGPRAGRPFGSGGGGSVRHQRVESSNVLVIASFAKAFGVPIAALSGPADAVRRYERCSQTRVHSSPPSVAHLRAAEAALQLNRAHGEQLRSRLRASVDRFRERVSAHGIRLTPSVFPVQTVNEPVDPLALRRALLARGIAAIVRGATSHGPPVVSLVVTALHTAEQIDRAAGALARVIPPMRRPAVGNEEYGHVEDSRRVHADGSALSGAAHAAAMATVHQEVGARVAPG